MARSHPKWGERPMAFVILHPQKADKWAGRHAEFEKDLKEHGDKVSPADKSAIEGALAKLKEAMSADDAEAIKAASNDLMQASMKLG